MEIENKFENLKEEYLNTINNIKNIPESSINDVSKIIYEQVMKLGNMTLETWLKEKIVNDSTQKKT